MGPVRARGPATLPQEAIGFLFLLMLVWLTELVGVPHLLFGEPAGFVWQRALFRTVVILAIWAWVLWSNRRLMRRLRKLEEFLRICSWCRKVGHNGAWLTVEDYFGSHLKTETSHGICPACAAAQLATHPTVTRVSKAAG